MAADSRRKERQLNQRLWAAAALRLILPSVLAIVIFLLAIFMIILPDLKENIMARKREMIRELVQTNLDNMAFLEARRRRGEISLEQAQELTIRQTRQERYGREMKDYFWINDMHPRMIMHPYRTDLEGKDISDFADPNGKHLFSEFVKVARQNGEGFVDYMWQWKDDPHKIVPKLSFIKEFKPWGWIVGTGIYLDDVDAEMDKMVRHFTLAALGTMGVIILMFLYIAQHNFRTERRRLLAERQLERSRKMLRLVMDSIPQYIYWRDTDGVFQGCNMKFAQLAGLSDPEEVVGKQRVEAPGVIEAEGRELIKEQEVMDSGLSQMQIVAPREGPGSARRWVESNRIPLRDEEGRVMGVLCTHEDITKLIEISHKLDESELRFRTLVEYLPVGIMILKDGRVVYSNPEQKRLFGVERDDFYFDELVNTPPGDLQKLYELDDQPQLQNGRIWENELRFYPWGKVYNSMEMRWVLCRATGINYRGGPGFLVTMLDIGRARELEYMVKVQDKMASLGRVAAGIAHEIRNPLSGVNMYLSALKESPVAADENAASVIEKIRAASGRIEAVVKRVLDFSRPTKPSLAWMQLNRALENVLELSSVTLRKEGMTLETEFSERLPLIYADQQLLEQVFLNLVTNAMQAMREWDGPKRLRIETGLSADRIVVQVSDSGPGVPPEIRDRIFDPFFTGTGQGSGIGLSLSRRIISDLGGSLAHDESRWGGALFTVRLPAVTYWGYDSHG